MDTLTLSNVHLLEKSRLHHRETTMPAPAQHQLQEGTQKRSVETPEHRWQERKTSLDVCPERIIGW
jgi:hypothetical protein